ncbi:GLPGLI family protein [uncultured Mucilaginibacter sp.]|uniref:GLPGLI family protein n=1 Tax=uncultured Mucilaginibacter sp. TaxID=797541 RepID=UPI0025D81688|nr:GLPGLI family protein [uncultured Mucilaginibacter sp.]
MKQYLLFFLLLFGSWQLQAQSLHAVYEYIPSSVATFREHVYWGNGIKTSIRDSLPISADTKGKKGADDESTSSLSLVVNTDVNYRNVVIQKKGINELVETRSIGKTNYLVSDVLPVLQWNTDYADTDTIGKYICNKATANYRGTKLIVFYTNSIPVPIGPYKFGGLPGLIVMLYNESANPNYWLLKEVSFPYDGKIPLNEKYIYALPKMSLQQYITKNDALVEEQMRMLQSKMPAVEGVTIERKRTRGTVEQIYEWEHKK